MPSGTGDAAPAPSSRRTRRRMVGAIAARLAGDRLHLRGPQGVGRAAGIPGQLSRSNSGKAWRRAPRSCMTSEPMRRRTGSIRSAHRTCTSPWRSTPEIEENLQQVLELARKAHHDLSADLGRLPHAVRRTAGRTQSVRLQGWTAQSACRRERVSAPPAREASIKAGEFILGYPDENGETALAPVPQESAAATARSWRSASSTWMSPRFGDTCGRRHPRRRKRS